MAYPRPLHHHPADGLPPLHPPRCYRRIASRDPQCACWEIQKVGLSGGSDVVRLRTHLRSTFGVGTSNSGLRESVSRPMIVRLKRRGTDFARTRGTDLAERRVVDLGRRMGAKSWGSRASYVVHGLSRGCFGRAVRALSDLVVSMLRSGLRRGLRPWERVRKPLMARKLRGK